MRGPDFAAARTAQTSACFATGLIAAKPVKPCGRGVFGALDLLLKPEQSAPGRFMSSLPLLPCSRLPVHERLQPASLHACGLFHWPPDNFAAPVCSQAIRKISAAAAHKSHHLLRYSFDSSEVREIVRWRRFGGLGFAPETGAKRALNGAELQGRFRTFAAFGRFPRRKPGRAGFRKQPLRARICAESAPKPR